MGLGSAAGPSKKRPIAVRRPSKPLVEPDAATPLPSLSRAFQSVFDGGVGLTGRLAGYEIPLTRSIPSHLTSGQVEAREDLPGQVIQAGLRIATAEPLTGGLLASSFAEMPGASRFFVAGLSPIRPT